VSGGWIVVAVVVVLLLLAAANSRGDEPNEVYDPWGCPAEYQHTEDGHLVRVSLWHGEDDNDGQDKWQMRVSSAEDEPLLFKLHTVHGDSPSVHDETYWSVVETNLLAAYDDELAEYDV
jgi:hypothetical protein